MRVPITNGFETWIHSSVAKTLGLALAHFVWEGAAIAAIFAVTLAIFRGSSAPLRYALACAALAAMPIAFGVTFAVSLPPSPTRTMVPIPLPEPSRVQFESAPQAPPESWKFSSLVQWAAPLWLAGVAGFLLYRFASWVAAQRFRRRGTWPAPKEWPQYVATLATQLGISRPVALLESYLAEVPMVIGYLRPVILVPIGMLAGWPLNQVEAILLHELAHIRRVDYLVNLAQTIIESLLFYHPAVWWISGVVRVERENCCDDFVLARDTDPRAYAAALLAMEQSRCAVDRGVEQGSMALAANGGHLLRRVRRILGTPRKSAANSNLAIGPVALAILGAGIALAAWQPQIVKKTQAPKPEIAQLAPLLTAGAQSQPQQTQGTINGLPEAARSQAIKDVRPLTDRANAVLDHPVVMAQAQPPQPTTDQQEEKTQQALERFQAFRQGLERFLAQAQQTQPAREQEPVGKPMTEQKQQQEQKLRQELESPYRKWLNEDAVYIITDAERKSFQALTTDNDREQFIEQFWKRRDPTPDTERNEYKEEHYRRIAYANERFKSGLPGWKTDRGRIYVQYGPADEVEAHPSGGAYTRPAEQGGGTTYTSPFQMWRYRFIEGIGQNVVLTFVDGERNGEYHLTTNLSEKDALAQPNPALATPEQGGRGRGVRGPPPAGAGQFDRPRDSVASAAPAGQPLQVVAGVPTQERDRLRLQESAYFFAAELAELRTKYTEDHPDVAAAKTRLDATQARLDQALRDEAANPNGGFGGKHSGVLIYPEGQVSFVIPLEGSGPFSIYGRIQTTGGRAVGYFEENQPAGPLNFVRTLTLKPGSYIFSVMRKGSSESHGATEVATFEVK
jgi:GWxTD domain-containing protein